MVYKRQLKCFSSRTLCSTAQSTSLSSHLCITIREKLATIVSRTTSSIARMSTVKFTCPTPRHA
jgi:hypothetical protein